MLQICTDYVNVEPKNFESFENKQRHVITLKKLSLEREKAYLDFYICSCIFIINCEKCSCLKLIAYFWKCQKFAKNDL